MQTPQRAFYIHSVSSVVPEKILALGELLLRPYCRENLFSGIWMKTAVVDFGGHCHRGRREVLHLFEMEIESFGLYGQFGHVNLRAARMRRYEVGNELLSQAIAGVYSVKNLFEPVESSNDGLRMMLSTESSVCSGATLSLPDT